MDVILVFIGIIGVVGGSFMLYRTKDVKDRELVEKGHGVHYEAWHISLRATVAIIVGFFFLLAGLLR